MSERHATIRFSYRANKATKVEVLSSEWKCLKLDYQKNNGTSKLFVNSVDVKFDKNLPKKVSFQYKVDDHKLGIKDKWIQIKPTIKSPIIICNYEKSRPNDQTKKITLRFTIDYKTKYGQNLFIVGSIPEFGFWNYKYAYKMTYVENNDNYNWQAEIQLKCLPEILTYKYFVDLSDGNKRFEGGSARYFELSDTLSNDPMKVIEFNDKWRNKNIYIKNKKDSSLITQLMTKNANTNIKCAKLIFYTIYKIKNDNEFNHLSKNKYMLSVVGDIDELGQWKPEKSLQLTYCKSGLWAGSINIDISETQNISFKFKLLLNILNRKDKKRVYEYYWMLGDDINYSKHFTDFNNEKIFIIEIGKKNFDIDSRTKISDLPFYANYKLMAEETVSILHSKKYIPKNSEEEINIDEEISSMISETITYKPDHIFGFNTVKRNDFCKVEVLDESTFDAAKRIQNNLNIKDVCVLNFASATQPGGGFLHGRQAQEEYLSRSSLLYGSLKPQKEMYKYHKDHNDPYYTDYLIYSPKVPVIRKDNGDLVPPYYVSVITSAAVNFNQILINYNDHKKFNEDDIEEAQFDDQEDNINDNNGNDNNNNDNNDNDNCELNDIQRKAQEIMFIRCEKILKLAIMKMNRAIVLGAFGCGVFKNDPKMICRIFKKLLFDDKYEYAKFFDYVVFAIKKGVNDSTNFDVFNHIINTNDEL